jgi:hypothetical protein
MAYAYVYVLAQLAGLSSAKNGIKERAEVGFRLFWNNINQQMMDCRFRLFWNNINQQMMDCPVLQNEWNQGKYPKNRFFELLLSLKIKYILNLNPFNAKCSFPLFKGYQNHPVPSCYRVSN